jgi:hypothetical protein
VSKRLLAAAALIAILGAGFAAIASGASHKVYVERDIDSQELAYRPHAIGLSGDGTFAMAGIKYRTYGGPVARATARAYVRGCTPNCAEGRLFRPRATLRLVDQIQCRGVTIYSRLRFVLHGSLPSGDRRHGTVLLRPLGEENGC